MRKAKLVWLYKTSEVSDDLEAAFVCGISWSFSAVACGIIYLSFFCGQAAALD